MKKATFISSVIFANLLFIFLQIHKSSQFIKTSYQKQKIDLTKNELIQEKEVLTHKLYTLKNRSEIKKYAQTILKLRPIRFNQIKRLKKNT